MFYFYVHGLARVWFGGPLNYRVDRSSVATLDAWILKVGGECSGSKEEMKHFLTTIAFTF